MGVGGLTCGAPCSIQVNVPAVSGDMGILANHVPSIEQLRPGVVDVVEEAAGSKQFFGKGAILGWKGLEGINERVLMTAA